MKTLITLMATMFITLTAVGQNYYKDGALFKINDNLTLKCEIFRSYIGLRSTKKYPLDPIQENAVAYLKDRSAFKKAFEETFTPEELEKYQNMTLSFSVTHDGMLKPVEVEMAFKNEAPGNAIPPAKFAELRRKLIEYLKFESNRKLDAQKYYIWNEGLIASIKYYLQPNP